MDLRRRLQERLADRFPGVQYPDRGRSDNVTGAPHWRYRMPLSSRFALASASAVLILFAGVALASFSAIVWALLK